MVEEKNKVEKTKTWYDVAQDEFQNVDTLAKAADIVWRKDREMHAFYQHYTTLSNVVTKVLRGQWWLSRSDSDRMNDRQESLKFGKHSIYYRTYQASFVHGAAESAAMWGLYVPEDPFAIRITIAGDGIRKWVEFLRNGQEISSKQSSCTIAEADFRDIIYAAVDFQDKEKTRLDIERNNGLYWSEVNSKSGIGTLEKDIKDEACTGWMKDYEWRHERESRLCVRIDKKREAKAMWVPVTTALIKSMKFTFSPWLSKSCESEVKSTISDAINSRFEKESLSIPDISRMFRRSVLQDALKLRYGRVKENNK